MTSRETREERGQRELEEQIEAMFRRPNRRHGSIRVTVSDDEHGREVDVEDEYGYDPPGRR